MKVETGQTHNALDFQFDLEFSLMTVRDITIPTCDGLQLPATHFSSQKSDQCNAGPTVIMSSAVAVPRKIYRHFAEHLISRGAGNVYTYDFRGVGETTLPKEKLKQISMQDWAIRDFPSVVAYAEEHHPSARLLGVGHSFGAQLIGLNRSHEKLTRFLCIASGTGCLMHTKSPTKLSIHLGILHLASFVFTPQIPELLSLGAKFPAGAFREWKRWSLSPNYLMSDPKLAENEEFSKIKMPLKLLGFSDDPFATRSAIEHLSDWFTQAPKEIDWIDEKKTPNQIGHMGFFRQENKGLWEDQSKWLLAA